jgi:hypothetical protein
MGFLCIFCRYGLHDTFHCAANGVARCMCVIPWDDDTRSSTSPPPQDSPYCRPIHRNWRLLTGHDSGNILLFDPGMPHLKPILTIQFPPFSNVSPRKLAVLPHLELLLIARSEGTVQLIKMINSRSHLMKSAIDYTKKLVCLELLLPLSCMRGLRLVECSCR